MDKVLCFVLERGRDALGFVKVLRAGDDTIGTGRLPLIDTCSRHLSYACYKCLSFHTHEIGTAPRAPVAFLLQEPAKYKRRRRHIHLRQKQVHIMSREAGGRHASDCSFAWEVLLGVRQGTSASRGLAVCLGTASDLTLL